MFFIVVGRCGHGEKGGPGVHQLRHADHDDMAAQRQGRDGVQRVRPVFQVAWCRPAAHDAEGYDPYQASAAEGFRK